ncbi:MAG: class I SAM-dependent methyltransferase [Thermodesulfobacteriota bacterium]
MLNKRYANDGVAILKLNGIQIDQKARIQANIDTGRYSFEAIPCEICKGTNLEQLAEKDRYGLYLPVSICRDCGLILATPRMTDESYNHFYNDGHRRLYVGKETPDPSYFDERYRAGKATFEYLSKHMNVSGMRILEVGCGSGAILKYLHDNGAIVKGIDLSREYLEYGRKKYGLDLSSTDLFELPDNHEFDLIIYSDVLEHILSPREHLEKIKRLLKTGGLLYIKVPGVKNIFRPYLGDFLKSLQNAHVYYYSLTTLRNLMNSCGFNLIQGNENVQGLWEISTGAPEQPTNDYADCMKLLRQTEKRVLTRKLLPVAAWCVKKLRQLISTN